MRLQLMAAALAVVGVATFADRASGQVYYGYPNPYYTYAYTFPPSAVNNYPYVPVSVGYTYPGPVVTTSSAFPMVRTYSTPVVYSTYTAPVLIVTRAWVVNPQGAAAAVPAPAVTTADAVVPASATTDPTVTTAAAATAAAGGTAVVAGGVVTASAVTTNLDGARVIGPVVSGPPVFQLGHTTYTPIAAPVAAPYVDATKAPVYYYSPYGYGTYNAFSGPYMSVGFGRGYGGWGWGRGWGYASWGYQW
jgi:hypothetical protein